MSFSEHYTTHTYEVAHGAVHEWNVDGEEVAQRKESNDAADPLCAIVTGVRASWTIGQRAIRSARIHGLASKGTCLALPPADGRAVGLNIAAKGLYTCNIVSTW